MAVRQESPFNSNYPQENIFEPVPTEEELEQEAEMRLAGLLWPIMEKLEDSEKPLTLPYTLHSALVDLSQVVPHHTPLTFDDLLEIQAVELPWDLQQKLPNVYRLHASSKKITVNGEIHEHVKDQFIEFGANSEGKIIINDVIQEVNEPDVPTMNRAETLNHFADKLVPLLYQFS